VTAGQIVAVDWRDALPGSGEPNKLRPGIIVGSERYFSGDLPFAIVVPLTSRADMAIPGASTLIEPAPENGCAKPCFALAWNVQAVPHARIAATPSHINADELRQLRTQIADCVAAL
jgi:mRNA-degrading endonuclease toxin of MazEF toxin-antitoxin module